jgi:hypothetical protein
MGVGISYLSLVISRVQIVNYLNASMLNNKKGDNNLIAISLNNGLPITNNRQQYLYLQSRWQSNF